MVQIYTHARFPRSKIKIADLSYGVPTGIASYPGRVGGERRPGIDCLRMRDHSQKNLGIRLRLEIVGKTIDDQYVYVRYISVSWKDKAVCQSNYLQLHERRG